MRWLMIVDGLVVDMTMVRQAKKGWMQAGYL